MNVTLCCVDSTLRIKREDKITDNRTLSFLALKGGYDSAQLIIRADKDLSLYLTAKDLRDENGNIFSKDNFKFYYEKYIYVDRNWRKNGFSVGWYPDALIPIDAPILHGENCIKANENGAIWVDVKAPINQPYGRYTGAFEIDVGKKIEITVVLELLNAVQPQQVTPKTIFTLNGFHMQHYEGAADEKMMDAYNKCMIEHHICSAIPSSDGKREWIDDVIRYIRQGANTINIPAPDDEKEHELYGKIPDFNDLFEKLLIVAEKSIEINENLFPYLTYYDWRIDEPFFCKIPNGKVKYQIQEFEKTVKSVIDRLKDDTRFKTSFGKVVLDSITNVPHLVTDSFDRPLPNMNELLDEHGNQYKYDVNKVTLCPQYNSYEFDFQRDFYTKGKEKWWYGCNGPNAPYPGYHIDDAGYVARFVGWLMADYGIKGTLYWACNFFQECNTTGVMQFFDDPYSLAHLGFGANGDGAIFYPGKIYGIIGPNPSIRVKAIRAGFEEYEILRVLYEGYAKNGLDFHNIFRRLTVDFSDGLRLDPFFNNFEENRKTLLILYELYENYGYLLSIKDSGDYLEISNESNNFIETFIDENQLQKKYLIKKKKGKLKVRVKYGETIKEFTISISNGIKVLIHEELYKEGEIFGDIEELSINYDAIRRKINVITKGEKPVVYIKLKENLNDYEEIRLLLRTKQPFDYKILNGYMVVSKGHSIYDWNCIKINDVEWKDSVIGLQFNTSGVIGLGEMYFINKKTGIK